MNSSSISINKQQIDKKLLLTDRKYFIHYADLFVNVEQFSSFVEFIDNLYSTKNDQRLLYNAMVAKATFDCMEKLYYGYSIEDTYELINVQNLNQPPIYYGKKLSGYQNYLVSQIISIFHPLGEEFSEYRSSFIKKQANKVLENKR